MICAPFFAYFVDICQHSTWCCPAVKVQLSYSLAQPMNNSAEYVTFVSVDVQWLSINFTLSSSNKVRLAWCKQPQIGAYILESFPHISLIWAAIITGFKVFSAGFGGSSFGNSHRAATGSHTVKLGQNRSRFPSRKSPALQIHLNESFCRLSTMK